MEFLRLHQQNIMLFLSGICFVLAILSFFTKSLGRKRRHALILMEAIAAMLLIMDRFAYIYRGNVSNLGYWMVRISNFCVYLFSLGIIHEFNLYLIDLFTNEGKLEKVPARLICVEVFFAIGTLLIIISQFTGLFYTFDEYNRYQRARGFIISYIFPFGSLLLQLDVIFEHYKKIKRKD